jgi:hypothetical protein
MKPCRYETGYYSLYYITDILTNIAEAQRFIGSMSYDEFTVDRKTSYAVVRCLEIIGEATKNVPEEIRSAVTQFSQCCTILFDYKRFTKSIFLAQ